MINKAHKISDFEASKSQISKALKIAIKAHEGQKDRSGEDYILHPITVMTYCKTTPQKVTAILHDIVEDTDVTLKDLEKEGFPSEIIDAVDAMTHGPNEPNTEYWQRVCENKIATAVKLADIKHNTLSERMDDLDTETNVRLTKKYKEAREYLATHAKKSGKNVTD